MVKLKLKYLNLGGGASATYETHACVVQTFTTKVPFDSNIKTEPTIEPATPQG